MSTDSDDPGDQVTKWEDIRQKSRPGMMVSGWDDDTDDLIEKDEFPHSTLEREILWASSEGKYQVVEEILRKKPSAVHAMDLDGYTPLHKACYNDNYELAELLLKYKANPNSRTEYKWTPLHSACKWNNARIAILLLQNGSDVNALSEGDQTPLHITTSVSNCRNTLISLFMNKNVNPELKNNSNEIASQIAKRSGVTFPLFQIVHSSIALVETGIVD